MRKQARSSDISKRFIFIPIKTLFGLILGNLYLFLSMITHAEFYERTKNGDDLQRDADAKYQKISGLICFLLNFGFGFGFVRSVHGILQLHFAVTCTKSIHTARVVDTRQTILLFFVHFLFLFCFWRLVEFWISHKQNLFEMEPIQATYVLDKTVYIFMLLLLFFLCLFCSLNNI